MSDGQFHHRGAVHLVQDPSREVDVGAPPIRSKTDLVQAHLAVTEAVLSSDITPEEGAAVGAVLESQKRVIVAAELERKLAAIDAKYGHG